MRPTAHIRRIARILAVLLVAGLTLLIFYLPIVAAIVLVALVVFLAVANAKAQGFWSGVRLFLKEILFGW